LGGCGGAGRVLSRTPFESGGATGRAVDAGQPGEPPPATDAIAGEDSAQATGGSGGATPAVDGKTDGKTMTAAGTRPLRVVFFYTPLGTVLESWRPRVSDAGELELSPILAPLEPFKARLLVVDGLSNQIAPGQPTSTHQSGPALLLTGRAGGTVGTAGGPSLDQHVAAVFFRSQAFGSLQLGIQTGISPALAISYTTDGHALAAESRPLNVNQRLFGGALGGAVTVPPVPSGDPLANDNFPTMGGAQIQQLVAALAYDLVGTATLSWGDVEGRTNFTWLGAQAGDYRYLAEHSGTPGPARTQFVQAQTWFAQQLATLLAALRDTPLGLGNMLDDTIVVWLSETGEASTQSGRDIPVVIVAPPGRGFRTGALVTPGTRSQGDLMATIGQVLGGAAAPDLPGASPITTLLAAP
jgi:hypothetical protein